MEFTIADGAVALVILISAVLAYGRGLTREALAIGVWVAAGFAAFYFAPMIAPLVREIPFLNRILGDSCELAMLAAFTLAFAVALIVLSIFTPVLANAVQKTSLKSADRALGLLFGVARGVALVGVLYLLYNELATSEERLAVIDASASHGVISEAANTIRAQTPTEMPPWLQARIDRLMGDCGGVAPPANGLTAPPAFGAG